MKFELPKNHSLSEAIMTNLIFMDGDQPALSDVQFAALDAGVGRGESVLVVSPTSTGKTHIALWAIAANLERGCNTIYLVTHRALAKQKFEDFKSLLLPGFLSDNLSALVIATGDYVEDAEGNIPAEPLRAPVLVATYEKYLSMLSAAGIPTDIGSTAVICDEIQLIGDAHRGQNVEMLLTLLRNARWKQFVGLSAVLEQKDAEDLASWLGVTLIVQNTREKHLRYECWTPTGMAVCSSSNPDDVEEGLPLPAGVKLDPISILADLLKKHEPPVPIIVFCMKKQDTYHLANRFLDEYTKRSEKQLSMAFDGLPETSANVLLSQTLNFHAAIHNADLMDEERHVVEKYLLEGKVDVVFATSTLAAGVNFPFGAAIFADWERWDFERRVNVPIEAPEFHNMAGRVGRMGFEHEHGRVILFAKGGNEIRNARRYLNLSKLSTIAPRVTTERFNQLVLQIVASGL
ncbi:MAG: DEAD/DEAH box helicase, partial [Desulfobulbaceae bacterium]|nr:DEAD/DEAH box helicase [Desulfobulbaceae bacterium]